MSKLIAIELKRLFSNKLSLALVILAPVITLLLLASIIAPLFFSNKRVSQVKVAIFEEEQSPDVQMLVENVTSDDQVQSLIDFVFVDSVAGGIALTESGEAALFVYIPQGIIEKLYRREPVTLEMWVSPDYAFESSIIMPIVHSVADGFSRIQTGMDVAYWRVYEEYSKEVAWDYYYDLSIALSLRVLNRDSLFEIEGISPLGRFLPLEYYTSAIYAFFMGLGLVPLSGYNAKDLSSAALSRGLASAKWRYKYLVARIISGSLYILIVSIPMLVVGLIIYGQGVLFSGNFLAVAGITLLSAVCFSTLSILLGLAFAKDDTAIWVAFYLLLAMALLGGVIFPDDYMPSLVAALSRFSLLKASMNGFAISLFDFNAVNLQPHLLILLAWFVVSLLLVIPLFNRRVYS